MNNKVLFGTDGIRGLVNQYPIDPITIVRIGLALGGQDKVVVIGKDTRASGSMLESSLAAGLMAIGTNVLLVGTIPTPAIALLTKILQADYGIVLSASHNHHDDNGIKIFNNNGLKLSIQEESALEKQVHTEYSPPNLQQVGTTSNLRNAESHYINFIIKSLPAGINLQGYKVVIDCANGASYKIAPQIFNQLNVDAITINHNPNGTNINYKCGVLHPQSIQEAVIKHKADIGISLDGDADRLILCDEKGQIINGEQILATIATKQLHKSDKLVSNIMASIAFENYLKDHKIKLLRSDVGDRHVMDCMLKNKCNIGGESSGHVILADHNTTSDGIMAALHILSIMSMNHETASSVCGDFVPQPSILKNIRYHDKIDLQDENIQNFVLQAQEELGNAGRLLIRKSGTEKLIRILAEGNDMQQVKIIVDNAAKVLNNCD